MSLDISSCSVDFKFTSVFFYCGVDPKLVPCTGKAVKKIYVFLEIIVNLCFCCYYVF